MMLRMIAAIGLLLALTGSAEAVIESFHAPLGLTGAQEAPTPVVSPGSGTGTAVFDSVLNTLEVDVAFSGLTSNTNNAHIHCCATLATSAGVAIDFVAPGFPLGVTSGSFSHTFDLLNTATYTGAYLTASGGTAAGARDRLLGSMRLQTGGNLGIAYFNIHTVNNPPGELRGNIAPIPEPAAVLLALCGFAAATCLRRAR
jgi:CHRD domain